MKRLLQAAILCSVLLSPSALPALAQPSWAQNEKTFMEKGKLLYKSGNFGDALGPFTDAINFNPQSAQAYYWRGIAFSGLNDAERAMDDLNQAIKLDPSQGDFYISRGLLYANKNQHELAIADFDHALQVNPTLTAARTNRDFCVQAIARQKKAAEDKIAQEKADAERLAAEKAAAEQAALEASLHPVKGKTKTAARTADKVESTATLIASGSPLAAASSGASKETTAVRRAKEEKLQQEVAQAERTAQVERMAREKLEAERIDREKQLTEAINKEKAENEKMAKELALANQKAQASKPSGDEQNPADRPVRDKWALIVGISKFKDSHLNLHYPSKDAQDLYTFLTKDGNFAKDHVHLLVDGDATRGRILTELGDKWLPRVAHPDDLVLIYISSHGSPSDMDVENVNYLLAYDTEVDNLYATGLPMQDLTRIIKGRVHSDRVVIMLDACHSGAASPDAKGLTRAANVNPDDIVQGTGQLVISSSLPNQVSWESKQDQNSVFTKYLMEGLKKNGSKTTLGDAFGFMKDRVESHVLRERGVLQTPVLKSKWHGSDLLICAPASAPGPGLEMETAAPAPAAPAAVAERTAPVAAKKVPPTPAKKPITH